jgi:integrase
MQRGSVKQTNRKTGPDVWQFRCSEKDLNGQRIYRKRVIGTVNDYSDPAAVRSAAAGLLLEVNAMPGPDHCGRMTIEQLCEHFEQRELKPGSNLRSVATQKTYRGYLRRWVKPALGFPLSRRNQGD